jgi:hypothetical protein
VHDEMCMMNFDLFLFYVQIAKIRIAAGDNLFDRLGKNQTISRMILKEAVPWTVCRLGPRFPSASLRAMMYPIVQTVVVEHNIAGIASHEEYDRLRRNFPDGEFALLQKIQETNQKNMTAFRHSMRNLVIPFFKESLHEKINHVKYSVFGVPGGSPLLHDDHPTYVACWALPRPAIEGTPAARGARAVQEGVSGRGRGVVSD